MERGSFLRRAVDVIGKVFLRGDGQEEKSEEDFTKIERDMLRRASRMEIIGGDYRAAAKLSSLLFKVRAERLKRKQPQGESGGEEAPQP